ncbi:hypothetical protein D3C80_994290 [compost metagenome]
MVNELVFSDTFAEWKDKINTLVAAHNDLDDIARGVTGAFTYNRLTSSGRVVAIFGGNVRNGSTVEFVANVSLTIPANSTRILAINKVGDAAATLQLYATNAVPEKSTIPVAIFTTNANSLTGYTDLRTEFIMASGTATSANAVLQFDKIIDQSMTIPAGRNALSVDPTIADGVTVTVGDGSVWVVL